MTHNESRSPASATPAGNGGVTARSADSQGTDTTVRVASATLKDVVAAKPKDDKPYVSPILVSGAAWGWRILVVAAVGYLVMQALVRLSTIVIPVAIALLLTVLLQPVHRFLSTKMRFPRAVSAVASALLLIAVLSGLLTAAGSQIASGITELSQQAVKGFNELITWAQGAPLNLDLHTFEVYWQDISTSLDKYSGTLVDGALSVTSTVTHILAGVLIAFFCTIFFLMDGRQIWTWLVGLLPRHVRERTHQAGRRGLVTLSSYVRTQILVAFIDAIGIAIGAAVMGLPLVVPMAALVFLGAFIPFVGAILTGAIAVLVALVVKGWVYALIMLGIVLLVQQIEGHLLQPLLMGHAVAVHPVGVLLAVAGGTVLGGIVGALFAVPVVAVLNTVILYFHGHDKFPELGFDDHIAIKPKGRSAYMVVSASKDVSDGAWNEVPEIEERNSEILDRIIAKFQNRSDENGDADNQR